MRQLLVALRHALEGLRDLIGGNLNLNLAGQLGVQRRTVMVVLMIVIVVVRMCRFDLRFYRGLYSPIRLCRLCLSQIRAFQCGRAKLRRGYRTLPVPRDTRLLTTVSGFIVGGQTAR